MFANFLKFLILGNKFIRNKLVTLKELDFFSILHTYNWKHSHWDC